MPNYPGSAPSFTAKSPGQTITSAGINAIADEVVAVGTALIGTLQHDVKLASGKYVYTDGNSTADGVWTSYTPTWGNTGTANTLGNGSITGKWTHLGGKTYRVKIALSWGSTTASGSGAWTFTLPFTAATLIATNENVGSGMLTDASAGQYAAVVGLFTTSTVAPYNTDALTNGVTATVPFAWTDTDQLSLSFTYEAA